MSDRSVLESKTRDTTLAQDLDVIHTIQPKENALTSKIPRLVQLRNSLGVVSFKSANIPSDDDDYKAAFKHFNRFSWLISHLLWRHTLTPNGNLLLIWTVMMTVMGAVVAGVTPLHIAFQHHSIPMWIFLYLLDGISLFHVIIIGPNTGYYNEQSILVLHPLATASHYLKTNFLIDLLSCLPYEVILIAYYQELSWHVLHFMAFLRLNRMLQLYRVVLAFDYLEMNVYRQTITLRKIKYLIYLCLFVSWMAALLFFAACPPATWVSMADAEELNRHKCSASSWIFSRSDLNEKQPTTFYLYTISLYLSATTFSSVGYGDFSAKLEHETLVLSIVILAGQLFFTYIIASITACVASADAQLARFKEKMLHVKSYMEGERIDEALQNRVIAYYEYLWLMTKGVQPHTLFSVLPLSLWSDVTLSLYEDVISSISLFRDTERSFIKTISRCIKPVLFLKGEFIVKKFDIGCEMYFVHRGAVDVVSEDGKTVYDTMNAGQAFGEVALLFSVPRTASIRAQANTYLFMLEKEELDTVLEFYPAIKHQIMRIAEDRRQQARKRSALIGPGTLTEDRKRDSDRAPGHGSKNVDDDEGDVWFNPDDAHLEDLDADEHLNNVPLSSIWGNEIVRMKGLLTDSLMSKIKSDGPKVPLPEQVPSKTDDQSAKDKAMDNISKNNPKTDPADEQDNKEFAEQKPRTLISVINPKNAFYVYFRLLICFINLVSCFLMSYQAAFQDLSVELFAVSYVFDFFFISKIFLNFHLAYYDAYGDLIDDPIMIRRHYLRNVGLFPVDLMTVFPFELLALAAPYGQQLSVLSYIRLMHLAKFYSIRRTLAMLAEDLSSSMLLIKIINNLISFTSVLHIVACLWYMIACSSEMPCHNTYMERLIGLASLDGKVHHSPGIAYLVSIYWSVATSTSTGYGDIVPIQMIELWYTIAVLIITRVQIGFIIGDLTSVLASVGAGRAEYKESLELFKKVLADRRAPPELEKQMVRYYNHLWLFSKGVDVRTLLLDLPVCLRAEIMETVAEDFWKSVPFFGEANKSFSRLLSLYTGQLVFTKGNYIIWKGDLASDLYFMKHGEAEDITDESNPKLLKEGQLFGIAGMLTNSTYRMTVRACTAVVVLTLSYSDLCKVLTNYPTVEQRIKDYAKRFYDIDFKLPDPDVNS